MKILAVDSALTACSVTIVEEGDVLAERSELRERGHAEVLMPMVEAVRQDAGLAYPDLDLVAVTVGPGSFTGIRVGVAAARGIALASGLRAIGVTTLAAMAAGAASRDGGLIVSIIDARRDEAYFQTFNVEGGVTRPGPQPPALESIADIAERLRGLSGTLVGNGAAKLLDELSDRDRWQPLDISVPGGRSIARCALTLLNQSGPTPLPTPLYIRKPDTNRPPKGNAG